MPHTETGHKILDILHHIWPYVSGLFVVLLASVKLWWHSRQVIKDRLDDNEADVEVIKGNMITETDLQTCRDDVRDADEKNLDLIFAEIKLIRQDAKEEARENARQHDAIQSQMIRLFSDGSQK